MGASREGEISIDGTGNAGAAGNTAVSVDFSVYSGTAGDGDIPSDPLSDICAS